MIAASKIETTLVSMTGDVIACRSREDASRFAPLDHSSSTHANLRSVFRKTSLQEQTSVRPPCVICRSWIDGNSSTDTKKLRGSHTSQNPSSLLSLTTSDSTVFTPPRNTPTFKPTDTTTRRRSLRIPPKGSEHSEKSNGATISAGSIFNFDLCLNTCLGNTPYSPKLDDVTLSPTIYSDQSPTHYFVDEKLKDSIRDIIKRESENVALSLAVVPSKFNPAQVFHHGVPRFLSELAQIKVTRISAHPLGEHVLLVAKDGFLFSYGSNNYGQLGHGSISHQNNYFVPVPTMITTLLENGGKAVDCAAGVDHSLVVIQFEHTRVVQADHPLEKEGPYHHFIYGFGSNDYSKLGLDVKNKRLSSYSSRNVMPSPQKVALYCEAAQKKQNSTTYYGIMSIACGKYHSAAIVKTPTGKVELYTWGKANDGALGLPLHVIRSHSNIHDSNSDWDHNPSLSNDLVVDIPTLVPSLSYDPSKQQHQSHPVGLALGSLCSIVITSSGECYSFGRSSVGLLGLGECIDHASEPSKVPLDFPIDSVTIGANHALAVSADHRVFVWGRSSFFPGTSNGRFSCPMVRESAYEKEQPSDDSILWSPQALEIPDPSQIDKTKFTIMFCPGSDRSNNEKKKNSLVRLVSHVSQHLPLSTRSSPLSQDHDNLTSSDDRRNEYDTLTVSSDTKHDAPVLFACAGYDNSIFLMKSGHIVSCGKCSGRLGQGEVANDLNEPRPLYGGLRFWLSR